MGKKLIIVLFAIASFQTTIAQTVRGELLGDSIPQSLIEYYNEQELRVDSLRSLTNFLTNRDIMVYQSYQMPKRKKAFMRHVKEVSEELECSRIDSSSTSAEMKDRMYELILLSQSLQSKAIRKAEPEVNVLDKMKMGIHTWKSKRVFKYSCPKDKPTLKLEPKESPYYHHGNNSYPLHKQFVLLANEKKIKLKNEMVVVFKELSLSGSAPKISTFDLDFDNEWVVKWGDEVHTDVVGSRIFAALGYDVDHPYYFGKDKVTLVFDTQAEVKNATELTQHLQHIYEVDLKPFISSSGTITQPMVDSLPRLSPFLGQSYVRFLKCGLEARPDRVKRIGSFLPNEELNVNRQELKGALLAHHFIGNWDTRESNTLLTTVHNGNYEYRMSAVFSDLGTCLGVRRSTLPPDFKVGLVNELPWEVVHRKNDKLYFTNQINAILPSYTNATYDDLYWMALKIAAIDSFNLKKMIDKAHWPDPIAELYFHKLASRRASIILAFEIKDPHPIPFDKELNVVYQGKQVVENGVLIHAFKEDNPEGFLDKKGRFRNYGH